MPDSSSEIVFSEKDTPVELVGDGPKYLLLKRHMINHIRRHRLQPGASLPSENQLSKKFSVARTTVRQAIDALSVEGVVERVKGSRTFVAGNSVASKNDGIKHRFALLTPESTTIPYYAQMMAGFGDACSSRNIFYSTHNTNGRRDSQADTLFRLADGGFDGVAVVTAFSTESNYQFRQLQQLGVSVVFINRRFNDVKAPLVAPDYNQMFEQLATTLVEHGHRRVAYLRGQAPRPDEDTFRNQLPEVLARHGIEIPEEFIYTHHALGEHSSDVIHYVEAYRAKLREILSAPNRPTVLFGSCDNHSELQYHLLRELGVDVPGQVSFVSQGGHLRSTYTQQLLTACAIDMHELAINAVDLLEKMCNGNLPIHNDTTVRIKTGFHQGKTLATANSDPIEWK